MTRLEADAVPGAFDGAARGYDVLVGLNPGYHAALRRSARALRLPASGARVLDLGCGTGASTAALLSVAPGAEVVAVDASAGMLARARRKPWPGGVSFVHARAEDLAEAGVTGPFDAVFAAYLVRNLPDPDPTLRVVRDLLRPGGRFVAHEFSVADSPVRTAVWTAVCWSVVIPAGWVVTRDARLYTYLWRSVLRFDGVGALRDRLRANGFTDVRTVTARGWQRGIAHAFIGHAPGGDDRG
ncbi:class I SAM-dependent methyltransferase [Saccharothrix obliqua]|uniref:class I SAM-dependent methyltransferase n=1 Tax=Saccharothrix obliqua TaxID=2861747 RepID=UPI001C5EF77D|nr:class I SAM-dependent methyltransferase [Saccharothrix obliqua]MBW4718187.1 class I SAM-dependent methyltransferase [Saccharothrix obliqua]